MMTFEEFKELALNSKYPENKYIYRVDVLMMSIPLKKIFELQHFVVGNNQHFYYLDKESAEERVKAVACPEKRNPQLYAVYIYEFPIDMDTARTQFQRVWVYDRSGNLLDHSKATEVVHDIEHPSAKYRGRERESIRFKAGDVVDVIVGGIVRRGIVVSLPTTIEEYSMDDCYKVVTSCRFPELIYPRTWQVLPVSFPISMRLREELINAYHEIISTPANQHKKSAIGLDELLEML